MHATWTFRAPFFASALRSCRPSPAYSPAARHIERTLFVSPARYPPRLPKQTRDSVSSRRNLSISPTPPRRAQYSRFDDDPNRPRPQFAGIRRDVIIYTLATGSVTYIIVQCVIYVLHLISHPLTSLILISWFSKVSNKCQRRVGGASWM